MKGITEDFLLFIVGLFVILIVLATVFGRGIAYNFLGFLTEIEPSNLQENIKTILTVASYSPGDFEAKIPINLKHVITLNDNPYPTILVEPDPENKLSTPTPQAFLTNCDIVRTCTRSCDSIGEKCAAHEDCCGTLSCDTTGHCSSTYGMCGNGTLEEGEECDTGTAISNRIQCNDGIDNDRDGLPDSLDPGCHEKGIITNPYISSFNETDSACPNSCTSSCACRIGYTFCKDEFDNDGDLLIDSQDPECHTDYNAGNPDSFITSRHEKKFVGETCFSDNECYGFLDCMSKVSFDKIGGTLVIKKYFENNRCKIEIQAMGI
jgi:hypothetical protein